jgi:aminoglycoside phosphotransferase (APT) family kinase protein
MIRNRGREKSIDLASSVAEVEEMKMTPAHHRAATLASRVVGSTAVSYRAEWTWRDSIVVEVGFGDGSSVFVKADGAEDVQIEAGVIERARSADVPTVEVLDTGTDDQLPGGRWMITRAASGRTLQDVGRAAPTIGRTLDDLAEHYARLHGIAATGFGPLGPGGHDGMLESWSQWQRQTIDRALDELVRSDAVSADFVSRADRLCDAFSGELDLAPAALLHADLGDREVFVEPETGAVTAIVDWGGALVGDPLYDLSRFVGGGPSDDPRPAQLHPTLQARYFDRRPIDTAHARRMLTFYRFHICVVEAAWEPGWAPGHVAWAERLMEQLITEDDPPDEVA